MLLILTGYYYSETSTEYNVLEYKSLDKTTKWLNPEELRAWVEFSFT